MMRRQPEHVFQFFMAELGTEGSIDGNQRLVIRGKYVPSEHYEFKSERTHAETTWRSKHARAKVCVCA